MKKPRKPRRTAPATRRAFTPVPRERVRHDGLTPERQLAFMEALAAGGCVSEACAAAGVSRSAVYALRVRPEAQAFRLAWDAALDLAVRALTDACFSRAMQGETVPHYYQGELVGEHRRYDNRLAMFLLRYRDPLRYAASLDQMVYSGHPERAGLLFAKACGRLMDEAHDILPPPDPEVGAPPFEAEPVGEAVDRQAEEALVASNVPIGGSYERRQRFAALRREHHRTTREEGDEDLTTEEGMVSMLSRLGEEVALIEARMAAEKAEAGGDAHGPRDAPVSVIPAEAGIHSRGAERAGPSIS
jgi:hypothetical protein